MKHPRATLRHLRMGRRLLVVAAALTFAGGIVSAGSSATTAHKLALRPQSDASPYTLTVNEFGAGSGTVTSSPAGIDCPGTCSAAFPAGTRVTLEESPAPGSTFSGWTGRFGTAICSGTNGCVVTLNSDVTVGALFVRSTSGWLTVALDGTGSGTVTSSPAGIDCPPAISGRCEMWAPPGTQITLTATADPGSSFAGWSGGGCSGTHTCVVTLNSNMTVTASFAAKPRLKVALAGTGSGTVTSSPAGIDCGDGCGLWAEPGTQFTLTATADPGSSFSGWGGVCSGTSTCVVTLNSDTPVSAWFASDSPPPPKVCVVPNVTGKTLAVAKKTIRSQHCSVGKITKAKSSPKNKGRVISQNPTAGLHLKNGTKVALKIGE
jgi:hypothetical protein